MYKMIIASVVLCFLQMDAMEKKHAKGRDNPFSIISSDGDAIPIPYKYAKEMGIFHPLGKDNRVFRSEYNTADITDFMNIAKKIGDKTIGPSSFQTRYDVALPKGKIPLSEYEQFYMLALDAGKQEHQGAIGLMCVAQELKAESCAIVFVSFLCHKTYHKKMFSSLMSSSKESRFQDDIDRICKNTYEPQPKYGTDCRDALAICNSAKQKMIANSSRTLVAKIDGKKNDLIVVYNQDGLIIENLWKQGRSLSSVTFSGNGSRFICAENVEDHYAKGFILFEWDTASWRLLMDPCFLLAGNIHTMCCNHDGTRLVASVETEELVYPEAGLCAPGSGYDIIVIDLERMAIIHRIPTESTANRMYWRSDNTFVTSFFSEGDAFDQWSFEKRDEKAGSKLNFVQKVFLYGLYERMKAERRKYYTIGLPPFIVPLMHGYVKDYLLKSLPKRLREWAKSILQTYNFTH